MGRYTAAINLCVKWIIFSESIVFNVTRGDVALSAKEDCNSDSRKTVYCHLQCSRNTLLSNTMTWFSSIWMTAGALLFSNSWRRVNKQWCRAFEAAWLWRTGRLHTAALYWASFGDITLRGHPRSHNKSWCTYTPKHRHDAGCPYNHYFSFHEFYS